MQTQPPSLLSTGTVVNGTLRADGDIRIDGTMDGDVVCANLTVGAHGIIRGDVRADTVTLRGRIAGTVHVRQLSLAAGAHVTGDITYQSLEAEVGARVEARFHHASHVVATPVEDKRRKNGREGKSASAQPLLTSD